MSSEKGSPVVTNVGEHRGVSDAPPDPWPLRHLVLRTPRLELRPDDDAGLLELVEEAYHGVHPPERMPFLVPWTDTDPDDLGRRILQHHWSVRARLDARDWTIHFLVRRGGRVVGTQGLSGKDFAATREVSTGSWLGTRHQGQGLGTEMRAAVLQLAFDHLGARTARSGAFTDNAASLAVSRRLGYREDGTARHAPRGTAVTEIRMLLYAEYFARPDWTAVTEGVSACRKLLDV